MKKQYEGKTAQILTFTVGIEGEKNVRSFLRQKHGISRSLLVELKHVQGIKLNGKPTYLDHPVQTGDIVQLYLPEEESDNIIPENIHFPVVYEDEDIIVVNKPCGMCVHPTMLHGTGTLGNAVVHHWNQQGISRKFRPVNRLDKDTSGLLVVAKSQYAHQQLAISQQEGTIQRYYQALVDGRVEQDCGTIEAPIKRKAESIMERMVSCDGQFARTHYEVLKRFASFTWLRLKLDTGRTHQIRVHMQYAGHPLLGDDMYGGPCTLISRQALHAGELSFPHPRLKRAMRFEAPLPEDMAQIIRG
ncbi:RluA family pseudouridine synthase [Aneurinibacillus sp. Ricciae_BoGa-3]|uniref:RluA family pseudouridine synthase n=1 Tax=Aneurinibacillus sp. Ricciae_BoGa-3 TaxID=3022697 RepID=UPI002341EBBE|nr:RluA family pseudouridine synthase [Aneurinibacillus sp. Ricciae_BoGa-3]WCK55837.1 RluA family pseudouridine synthase [Aneurinibacillus sp. Ricciae_BoGa-3]